MAWSGNSNGYIKTVINLGPNLVEQTFRSDSGWEQVKRWQPLECISIISYSLTPDVHSTTETKCLSSRVRRLPDEGPHRRSTATASGCASTSYRRPFSLA